MVSLIKFDPYLLLTPERPSYCKIKVLIVSLFVDLLTIIELTWAYLNFFFRHCLHESYVEVEIRLSFSD